ncbi:uncharacterized protein BDW43DRAFT_269020 [Aspergillus alliaceus]|uniref:uncharacterized protein n=1 Tax=Petromyces alliaceus TaxID=209559 RepID=UPI0012A4821F|nr:uncharacterized protein BDW43DRAFT_269020 [Aspergillus alliaceus]KAB8236054.1 hypothetical protein BDW43DRAFT_269020 [Aspergillus alliaceus]
MENLLLFFPSLALSHTNIHTVPLSLKSLVFILVPFSKSLRPFRSHQVAINPHSPFVMVTSSEGSFRPFGEIDINSWFEVVFSGCSTKKNGLNI